jgi:hypothetical protein
LDRGASSRDWLSAVPCSCETKTASKAKRTTTTRPIRLNGGPSSSHTCTLPLRSSVSTPSASFH